ncbi:INO80 complex subunit E [Nymphon striatum]|nr:INO80 complex subunit E [Nymphon striatum]
MPVSEDIIFGSGVYLQKYKILKRKLKLLIYENECFQDNLRNCQRKLLKVERDKAFLLDRLLQYEHADDSSSDSDATLSSESDIEVNHSAQPSTPARKKKLSGSGETNNSLAVNSGGNIPIPTVPKTDVQIKRKKPSLPKKPGNKPSNSSAQNLFGHMTSEEIERHLESKQPNMDLMPERAPSTMPTEMFSNDPSGLDSEQNDGTACESSPSNIGEMDESLIIDLPES